jgi:putative membrane protein
MSKYKHLFVVYIAATLAILFSTPTLHAQTAGTGGNAKSSTGSAADTSGGKVSKADQGIMRDIAHANLAEIETGKLALDKSQNDQIKKFAQQMIDDHTTAMNELTQLAQSKGVTLPAETDLKHKTMATALKALSGDKFDKQYISQAGVTDHQRTRDLLQKAQKSAKDPDLKAYVQKVLPIVNQHLAMAQQLANKK